MSASASPALWSAQAHMPTVSGRQVVVTEGDGAYVWDDAGRRLFDATAGLWHANIGHSRPEIAQAAAEQMRSLETYHVFGRFVNDQALTLAERLTGLSPIPHAKVFLTSGGSDSVEAACKLARRYWQVAGKPEKQIVLSRENGYHGLHGYGTSITGLEFNREGYGTASLIPETARIPMNDLEGAEKVILDHGAERIAAVIAEPVVGSGGVYPPADGYLQGLQDLAQKYDILFIVDEVITGFGRMGTMFATEYYELSPDLITMAKGVTSGYAPLGGVLISQRLWSPFFDGPDAPAWRHGLTYAGHATAAAVAMANLDALENESLVARAGELAEDLQRALTPLTELDGVPEVRQAGLLAGVQLADHLDAQQISDRLIDEHGQLIRPLPGNSLQISPPFVSTAEDFQTMAEAIATTVTPSS